MILQALNDYYERKFAHQASATGSDLSIAPKGFENKEIPFVLVLDASGALVQIDDTRSGEGKTKRARSFLLPQGAKKSVNIAASLLWGNAEYVFGIPDQKKLEEKQKKGKEQDYRERLNEMHQAFIGLIHAELASVRDDEGVAAVLAFLASVDHERLAKEAAWAEIADKNPNLTFRLAGDGSDMPVCARPAVVAVLKTANASTSGNEGCADFGFCLVRGQPDRIARLHPAIKNVWGAQSSGANIVSFNLTPFNSHGMEQGANAPVGDIAAFNYTAALNHLLRKDSPQRLQVGDASTVFWAADASGFEDDFAAMFAASDKDDPDRGTQAVRNLLEATRTGVYMGKYPDARFCVLGLAPNAARTAIRFWQIGPVKQFARNIARHFRDIALDKPAYESSYPSLFRLMTSIALQNKAENVPPNLAGDTMRAILAGLPYPESLLQAAIRRCRAEQKVSYPRAALIKACLNRSTPKELTMSLDPNNNEPGYRLGRLFAALERIQNAAQPGINATIRDRYYGAASSSPSSVFPILLKLKNHHLSKLDNPGLAAWFEKILREIFSGLAGFPAHLSLPAQGLFAVGYYHQQQDFFRGKAADASDPAANPNEEP
ncbi:MAG: type I-C CRISPR-associated protein Cas8c/Csd1 [Proteobacteria bacterium]|nr:type I-C CRISPR-associated protein Cas8c/Csd1 [Pseudomonadota bacterium]